MRLEQLTPERVDESGRFSTVHRPGDETERLADEALPSVDTNAPWGVV